MKWSLFRRKHNNYINLTFVTLAESIQNKWGIFYKGNETDVKALAFTIIFRWWQSTHFNWHSKVASYTQYHPVVSIHGNNPPTSIGIQKMPLTHNTFRWSPYVVTIHLLQLAFKRYPQYLLVISIHCDNPPTSIGIQKLPLTHNTFRWSPYVVTIHLLQLAFKRYPQYLLVISIHCDNPPTSIGIQKLPLTHNTFRWSPYNVTIHPLQSALKRCLLHTIPSGGLNRLWQSTHFNRHSKDASYTQYLPVVSIRCYNPPTSIGIQKLPLTHNTFWSSQYIVTIHPLQSAFKRCLFNRHSKDASSIGIQKVPLQSAFKRCLFNRHSKDAFYTQYLRTAFVDTTRAWSTY